MEELEAIMQKFAASGWDQFGRSGFSTDFTNIDEDIIYREF